MKLYKKVILIFFSGMMALGCMKVKKPETIDIDLSSEWDTTAVLENPYKGWYHHFYANTPDGYGKINDPYIDSIPNLEFLYFRLAWSYFEPEEGKFDWSYIDDVMEVYLPKGLKMAVCVTAKETGIPYATPEWVRKAGAMGHFVENWGLTTWEPVWDDPVFLEKLDNFHKAFADRYDAKDWFFMVDIGSIGEWGEGHTGFSTAIPPTEKQVKSHIDIYTKYYKNTQVVINDDYHYWGKEEDEANRIYEYVVEKNLALSEWSAMVEWYVDNFQETNGISHPHVFDEAYLRQPVTLESHHYKDLEKENNAWNLWSAPDGKAYGAAWLLGTMKRVHATYLSFQGWPEDYVKDNPEFLKYAANKLGYWYFPESIRFESPIDADQANELSITWYNKGLAPAYHPMTLKIALVDLATDKVVATSEMSTENLKWMPGESFLENYTFNFNKNVEDGQYVLAIGLALKVENKTIPIRIGFDQGEMIEPGLYPVLEVEVD